MSSPPMWWTSPPMCCATAWCRPTRLWPKALPPTSWSPTSCAACPRRRKCWTAVSLQTPETILRRLDLKVARRLAGLLPGDHRSAFRGQGLDLADLREDQYHDDVRHMDWNVTARLQIPHVREYLEDREITAWFLLDMSPSIEFESVSVSKRAVLVEFTAMVCRLLAAKGNRTGAILFSGEVEKFIPARGGRQQLLVLLDALTRYRDPKGAKRTTDLARVLTDAATVIRRRRSLVFIVSDFITGAGWEKPLA